MDIVNKMDLRQFDAVLCVGGDGIIHEVINGMANRDDGSEALQRVAIGVIPAGTIFYKSYLTIRIWYGAIVCFLTFRQCYVCKFVWQLRSNLCCLASCQMYFSSTSDLILVKPLVVDLMSVAPVDKSQQPTWLFVSVAFGWIAYADIHTESWRYGHSHLCH